MAGYSPAPLARKLGVRDGASVLVDGAPAGFTLDVAAGAEPYDLILCFCPDLATLAARWPVLHPRTTAAGALWIAWSKKSSGVPTDLTGDVVREFVLTHGRVDVKVCAIDDTWSGLKNVIRVTDR